MLKQLIWISSALALGGIVASCGGGDSGATSAGRGGERQPCYPNGTCNTGLACLSKACVLLPEAGMGGGMGDRSAGNGGDGTGGSHAGGSGAGGSRGHPDASPGSGGAGGSAGADSGGNSSVATDSGVDSSGGDARSDAAPAVPRCGDRHRDPGEQCDDGNLVNLDGCSAACSFEEVQRVDTLTLALGTDADCTVNSLAPLLTGTFGQFLAPYIVNALQNGLSLQNSTLLLPFVTLADPQGGNGSVSLGFVGATFAGAAVNPLDAWYTAAPTELDALRHPLLTIGGTIASKNLAAGPGALQMTLDLGSGPHVYRASHARLFGHIGASSAPLISAAGTTSGHLASENLDPALTSFASIDGGRLCGNLSAESLASALIPAVPSVPVAGLGTVQCDQGYTTTNSMLDLLASGCTVAGGSIVVASAVQPDQTDPQAAVAGAGAPYQLVVGSGAHVTGCKDTSQASVDLGNCLRAAAYSTFFQFTSKRAIAK
jgi:cysteine-rich repeat protein